MRRSRTPASRSTLMTISVSVLGNGLGIGGLPLTVGYQIILQAAVKGLISQSDTPADTPASSFCCSAAVADLFILNCCVSAACWAGVALGPGEYPLVARAIISPRFLLIVGVSNDAIS